MCDGARVGFEWLRFWRQVVAGIMPGGCRVVAKMSDADFLRKKVVYFFRSVNCAEFSAVRRGLWLPASCRSES